MTAALLVFGATSTIATEVARLYAQESSPQSTAPIILVGRDPDALARLQADISARTVSPVHGVVTDLADSSAHPAVIEQVKSFLPADLPIHALIAYGQLTDETRARSESEYFETQMRTNFVSTVHLTQLLSNWLSARNDASSLAVISSVAGDRGRQSNYVYGAAKAGVSRFLEGLAHAQATSKLAIIDIRPGFVDTKMTANFKKGPLWAAPERVAADIAKALRANCSRIVYTPRFWSLIMMIIRNVPSVILHRTKL